QEHVEDFGIGNGAGIVGHTDRFGMSGGSRAYLLVSGIGHGAADISAFHLADADDIAKHRLGAPEAAAGHDCRFHLRHLASPWRYKWGRFARLSSAGGRIGCRLDVSGRVSMRMIFLAAAAAAATLIPGVSPAVAQQTSA